MAALAVAGVIGLAACSESGSRSPTDPTPIGPGSEPVHYAALAASDGVGYGSSSPCPPFVDCPDGLGYVQIIARRLRASREVRVTNLSLPAAVLSPELEQLGNSLGRGIPWNLLQRGAPFVPTNATLVTIFTGGNDTNTIAAGAAVQGGNAASFIDAQVNGFRRDFVQLLDVVRQRAPAAQVVVMNVPNFAALPFTQGFTPAERRIMQDVSVRLSVEAINPQASRVTVVDLLCDPRSYTPALYSADGFHPSDAGYRFLSEIVLAAIQAGNGAPRPAAGCAYMQIV
jgi:lysophospholipase L1-like esterase